MLTEAFRRGELKWFVDRELFKLGVVGEMLERLHSGFSVHDSVWLDEDDAAADERVAHSARAARCRWSDWRTTARAGR